jgi:hypothetical protein
VGTVGASRPAAPGVIAPLSAQIRPLFASRESCGLNITPALVAAALMAVKGRFGDHHTLMCWLHLDQIDHLKAMTAGWTRRSR